jgi:glutathionylspermidine synthase
MNLPFAAGEPLSQKDFQSLRTSLIFDYCKWDIQSDDHSVIADFPLLLDTAEWKAISGIAERLAAEALDAEKELIGRKDLFARLAIPRPIQKVLSRCAPDQIPKSGPRVMRFDFHFTSEGRRISEVNADVPGGFIEASGLASLIAPHYSNYSIPPDAASTYANAISQIANQGNAIALVHATAHSDDRQVMEYLSQILRRLGHQTIFAAPNHLQWNSGTAQIKSGFASATPAALIRFFPAEWLPNIRPTAAWQPWFCGACTPVSNPGSAILIQSKRFPLAWPELRTSLSAWREFLPETKYPNDSLGSRDNWVFKPIFGRVGEDIAIDGVTEPRAFLQIMKDVQRHPHQYIAQRRFKAVPIETPRGPKYVCLGIFTVDGRAAGIYGRIASTPLIDQNAQDIAVLLNERTSTERG